MRWQDFIEAYPKVHLIIATVEETNLDSTSHDDLMTSLRSLVASSGVVGDFAISSIDRQQGVEFHIALHKDYDATRLAELVHAVPESAASGWMSLATFSYGKLEPTPTSTVK